MNELFEKYQQLLLQFANQNRGGLLNSNNAIIKITPSTYHELISIEKDKAIIKATCFTTNWIEQKLGLALRDIDIIQQRLLDRNDAQRAFKHYMEIKKGKYPRILNDTTLTANATGDSVLHQYQQNVTWTTAVNATDGTDALENQGNNVRFVIAYFSSGLTAQIRRTAFIYDTSSIPLGSTILQIQEKIYVNSVNNPSSISLAWTGYTGSKTTPSTADYDTFGSTEFATRATFASLTTSAYNTFTLNSNSYSSIVMGSGTSAIGHRTSADLDDSLGSGSENNIFADYETVNPAQLLVTYAAGGLDLSSKIW